MQRHFCLLWPCLVVLISLAVTVHKQGLIDSGKFCFEPRVMKRAHTEYEADKRVKCNLNSRVLIPTGEI